MMTERVHVEGFGSLLKRGNKWSIRYAANGRRCEESTGSVDVEVAFDRAAALSIYSQGGESIEVTAPPGGYQLDAVTKNGEITVPEGTVEVTTSGDEHRAAGPIRGGGPTITLRSDHGDITVKER